MVITLHILGVVDDSDQVGIDLSLTYLRDFVTGPSLCNVIDGKPATR